ncbi:MAG: 1,4-alpha-glucan branching protein GlgB [Archaeoglobaceae archaeon]
MDNAKSGRKTSTNVLSDYDIYLFKEGNHFRLHEKLGSHLTVNNGREGAYFAVWAPNARSVSVIGNFNQWNPQANPLKSREDGSGVWEGFIPGVAKGDAYKYHIVSIYGDYTVDKADPFAYYHENSPKTASIVWDLEYDWGDEDWMSNRQEYNSHDSPISVYEVHAGSWMRAPEENNRFLNYRELAPLLANHVKKKGFTHVEFMPVMEHPFYGSWGYQTTGYFAPTSRYGTPQDFMYLVDYLHQQGIGVILDWVPSHFPNDEHGLVYFDGTHLFEHADTRKGYHPDWKSSIFNYGRNEVRNFLISSAMFWADKYHADGIRLDAVASMLYLDYSRGPGEWIPNEYGGNENLEAISFIRTLNEEIHQSFPGILTIAEESTAWPMVSHPTYVGGLGFDFKWNMGWMHDTLHYFSIDTIYRKFHHSQLTFSIWYAFTENFMLPLSHDEVVHMKGSLLGKMPGGEDWQKFSNLRLLLGYMFAHPGKKLLFMGGEFGHGREWSHDDSLDWHLLDYRQHQGVNKWVEDVNHLYRSESALQNDLRPEGFEWIDFNDWEQSTISFIRRSKDGSDAMVVVCNFTPIPRYDYQVGVPEGGYWKEVLNSDAELYGGNGYGNLGGVEATNVYSHGKHHSLSLTLPPLGVLFLKKDSG